MARTRSQSRRPGAQESTSQQCVEKKQRIITLQVSKPKHGTQPRRIGKSQSVSSRQPDAPEQMPKLAVRRFKRVSTSLKVVLQNIRYTDLGKDIQAQDYKILRQEKRLQHFKGRYFPPPLRQYQNRYCFMFGHNPFQHTSFRGPTTEEQWEVYELMKKDLEENFGKQCFLDQPDATTNELQSGPMHMGDDLSVDNLIKVILSISTENSLAIRQHAQLCSKFTYTIDGKEVKGKIPNYHRMRTCSADELVRALNIAGHHNLRQKAFHSILNEVYEQNVRRLPAGGLVSSDNQTGATDFVPGLLSMDYLESDGLSKQERFDLLVKFDQIAVKTGCCLLAFNLKIPVFVVDTHVHNMARSLQWIPEDCYDADKACMFLDSIMDVRLKFGLHQAFWHHRIKCARCMPRANPQSLAYQQRMCPLESLIERRLPSMSRSIIKDNQGTKPQSDKKNKSTATKTNEVRKLPGSVTFLNIYYKRAEESGYSLRKVDIDDDFGDGARQNKDRTANYYWGQNEFTHVNDVVKLEDALEAVGMTQEDYEARFVKKVRNTKKRVKKEPGTQEANNATTNDTDMIDNDTRNKDDNEEHDDENDIVQTDDDSEDSEYEPEAL